MKGINNQQCIGPCLPKDTITIHPIYLYPITDNEHNPFCPTFQWTNNNGDLQIHDICKEEDVTSKSKINKKDMELLYAIPNFGFDCTQFLKNYYDLHSFEGVLDWISSENNSIYTKLRVINCAWEAFGNEKRDIIYDQLIEFYMEVIKKLWINEIYSQVFNYISVDKQNNISFKIDDKETNKKTHKIEKINFFLDKFSNRSIIYNVLKTFSEINKSKWKTIKNYNNELKKYYIDYVLNKIKTTLTKK